MTNKFARSEARLRSRPMPVWIAAVATLFLIPVVIYGVQLVQRLDGLENSLKALPSPPLESDPIASRGTLSYQPINLTQGQVVYVPAYSHIYHGNGESQLLTITLSVRNTSTEHAIVVDSVRYYDTAGKLVKSYLSKPLRLPALATTEVLVERDDASGGSGANFLVEWFAEEAVSQPIMEAVMIDTRSQQGISFVCRGVVIQQTVFPATEASTPTDAAGVAVPTSPP